MKNEALLFIAISFAAASVMAAFTAYEYRRGDTLTIKNGWRTRTEHPWEFWWGIFISVIMALILAAPGISVAPEI
jgi:hypothetical protein